jgi:hypothetical protein
MTSSPERSHFVRFPWLPALVVTSGVALGCGSDSNDDVAPGMDAGSDAAASGGAMNDAGSQGGQGGSEAGAGGRCNSVVDQRAPEGALHVAECSVVEYQSNPPASGSHYGIWAAYVSYPFAVPRGYWVHSLEHGAVVITYDCPEGCADEVAMAQAFIDALPADPICSASAERRVILTPDPLLDVRWAASAWEWTLQAECFDAEAFALFYSEHVGRAPEETCADGFDFRSADGGSTIQPGCGE